MVIHTSSKIKTLIYCLKKFDQVIMINPGTPIVTICFCFHRPAYLQNQLASTPGKAREKSYMPLLVHLQFVSGFALVHMLAFWSLYINAVILFFLFRFIFWWAVLKWRPVCQCGTFDGYNISMMLHDGHRWGKLNVLEQFFKHDTFKICNFKDFSRPREISFHSHSRSWGEKLKSTFV